MGTITGPLIMLVFTSLVPIAAFFWLRSRTAGRMLCWVMDEDRSAKQMLLKVKGDFISIDDERYIVSPEVVRLIRYPTGWPKFMQQVVPCSLYSRGNAEPIDWTSAVPQKLSSIELGSILDPNWMRLIVRGTKEQGVGGQSRLITFATLGIGAVTVVLMFYVVTKMGALEGLVTQLAN